mmetsp:Transcript_28436/g.72446  ORF Transcript_28436/g.72446 Transcript_28436/m.72446 type:complete len:235 (+) Transcript_28436:394-1098(+)
MSVPFKHSPFHFGTIFFAVFHTTHDALDLLRPLASLPVKKWLDKPCLPYRRFSFSALHARLQFGRIRDNDAHRWRRVTFFLIPLHCFQPFINKVLCRVHPVCKCSIVRVPPIYNSYDAFQVSASSRKLSQLGINLTRTTMTVHLQLLKGSIVFAGIATGGGFDITIKLESGEKVNFHSVQVLFNDGAAFFLLFFTLLLFRFFFFLPPIGCRLHLVFTAFGALGMVRATAIVCPG